MHSYLSLLLVLKMKVCIPCASIPDPVPPICPCSRGSVLLSARGCGHRVLQEPTRSGYFPQGRGQGSHLCLCPPRWPRLSPRDSSVPLRACSHLVLCTAPAPLGCCSPVPPVLPSAPAQSTRDQISHKVTMYHHSTLKYTHASHPSDGCQSPTLAQGRV